MAGIGTARRYYLLKGREAEARGEDGLALVWWSKQDALSGTDLPADFPSKTALAALRYTKVEDLKGENVSADIAELTAAGLPRKEAQAVIAALEDL